MSNLNNLWKKYQKNPSKRTAKKIIKKLKSLHITIGLKKIVFIADLHIPYQDKKAVDLVLKFLADYQPDILILGGDLIDFYSLSKFCKDPRRALDTQEDIDKVVEFLTRVRKVVGKDCLIIYLEGNHEFRLQRYKFSKCPELAYIRALEPQEIFKLEELNIVWIPYHEYYRIAELVFHHGTYLSKHSAYSAKNTLENTGINVVAGHCYSDDTELLTKDGWLKYDKLKIGQEALTYNIKTGNSEWNKINEIFVYDDYKELIHFKSIVTDLLVTPNHNIVRSPRWLKCDFRLDKAKNCIGKRVDMPNGGKNTNKDYEIDDDFLRLASWVITEGNYSSDCRNIRIAQSEKEKVGIKHITDICDRLGQKYTVVKRYDKNTTVHGTYRNYDAYRIILKGSNITERIKELFPNKQLNSFLYNLSYRQWKLFFHEMILGDGNKNYDAKRSFQYGSKYEKEMDILQGLCAFNGWRSSKIKRDRDGCIYYILTINTRRVSSPEDGGKIVKYDGKVWGVSVKNRTLVVRRNGKPIVSGNSHRTGKHNKTNLTGNHGSWESGCLCDLHPEYVKGVVNWQQGFCVIEYHRKRVFYVYDIDIIPYSDKYRYSFVFDGEIYKK